jgi:hypothetical protein
MEELALARSVVSRLHTYRRSGSDAPQRREVGRASARGRRERLRKAPRPAGRREVGGEIAVDGGGLWPRQARRKSSGRTLGFLVRCVCCARAERNTRTLAGGVRASRSSLRKDHRQSRPDFETGGRSVALAGCLSDSRARPASRCSGCDRAGPAARFPCASGGPGRRPRTCGSRGGSGWRHSCTGSRGN